MSAALGLRRYRAAAWIAGRLIVYCARLAVRVGDAHEFAHCRAAVEAGNSDRCKGDCRLNSAGNRGPDR